ncbi:hypothetical protein ES708_16775 [subsurface metagenome]
MAKGSTHNREEQKRLGASRADFCSVKKPAATNLMVFGSGCGLRDK